MASKKRITKDDELQKLRRRVKYLETKSQKLETEIKDLRHSRQRLSEWYREANERASTHLRKASNLQGRITWLRENGAAILMTEGGLKGSWFRLLGNGDTVFRPVPEEVMKMQRLIWRLRKKLYSGSFVKADTKAFKDAKKEHGFARIIEI